MAFSAISFMFRLFCLTLFLTTILCTNGLKSNPKQESVVSIPTSLPLHLSLDYPLESDCNQRLVSQQKGEILIISTLDGKLSALDVESGQKIWSNSLSSEPLLSSTISNFEITRKGRVVRVVPSLDGNLYLFNGKTIDGIPLNADILLKSSFKLGDDLVITGGQESHISGIDITTGKVYYECGLNGCPSTQLNENETFDDLFLLKRITQTVRAIDPRNGRQKWFFSVTEPKISETSFSKCHDSEDYDKTANESSDSSTQAIKETDFNIIVPNGFISVKRYSDSNDNNQWNYRFGSPIVHVWHYRSGRINSIDLFDKRKLFGLSNIDPNLNGIEPTVYIGLYRHQWYVQSSEAIKSQITDRKKVNDLLSSETNKQIDSKSNVLQIEWKPKAIVFDTKKDVKSEKSLEFVSSPQFSLSISSENEENVGYYIFDAIEDNETKCLINSREDQNDWDFDELEEDLIQQIVIASLWHYWREVTAISIVSAFVLNFFYSYLKRKLSKKCKISQNEEINANTDSKSKTDVNPSTPPLYDSYNFNDNNSFNSRYESDFEPIQVLGRGGFGLVFEAKHIIDESHYAIKRIGLPIREEQREKVMREVRALSKLEHSGIVRYYNAWVEFPPPGWQENKDKQFNTEYDITKTQFNESLLSNKRFVTNSLEHKKTDIFSETDFDLNSSQKLITTETQSLDIVFDDNISSIKLVETNKLEPNFEFTTEGHNNLDSSEDTESSKVANRPLSLKTGPLSRCYLYIQMQLCRKETLKDWLFSNSLNRDSRIVLDIFDQIVSAVDYVHSRGLMHRDLKPSNIFFSMDGNIKIGDFGLVTATAVDDDTHTPAAHDCEDTIEAILNQNNGSHTNRVGTQLYMSPEQIKNLPYSHKVDIFSMGIILFELLVPFNTEMERNLLLNNARKQRFPEDFCIKFIPECDLLKKLLAHNPDKRPTTLEIKEHEVLRNLQSISGVIRQRSRTLSMSSNLNNDITFD